LEFISSVTDPAEGGVQYCRNWLLALRFKINASLKKWSYGLRKRFLFILFTILLLPFLSTTALAEGEVSRLLKLTLPETLTLCGEEVPLNREDVRERLELEMLVVMGNPVQTTLWLKRMPRFFPIVEAYIEKEGLPTDLKYVSVVESNLRADALSSAGASGPWQFMRQTGRMMGLNQRRGEDQRRDWEMSTSAALEYLEMLHDEFSSWTLALAAYNAGRGTIMGAMKSQSESDYYGLKLSNETERYLFRIMAVKLLSEEPERYGIDLEGAICYEPRDIVPVELVVERRAMPLAAIADAAGVSYRYLTELNPWMTGSDLPKGSYKLMLPTSGSEPFAARLDAWEGANPEPEFITHKVKKGDNLYKIAKKYAVNLSSLLATNGLKKKSVIHPGQKLLVPSSD